MDLSKLQNGSDVRGVALAGVENEPVTLDDAAVRAIAGGFARFLRARLGKESCRVSVGRDSRLSGGAIAETLCETLAACGAEVTDLGLCTTPAMFMTTVTGERPFDAAVMITASHLPWNRNGLKFFTAAGGAESADVREILRLAAEETPLAPGGSVAQGEFMEIYAAILREKIIAAANGNEKPRAGKHIVVDAGNGAGGFFAERVLAPLGADTAGSRYLDPDGRFPNHVPNPELPEAMDSIREAVLESHADFGVIFDTDVDRAGAVLSNGEELNRNRLIALISAILLREHPGTAIGALKENYFLDDGAYLVTRFLREIAAGRSLESLLEGLYEPVESREFRLKILAEDFRAAGTAVLDSLAEYAKEQPGWSIAPDNCEGVRVNLDKAHGDGWFLLRLSLHDPILPLNIESDREHGARTIARELAPFLAQQVNIDASSALEFTL